MKNNYLVDNISIEDIDQIIQDKKLEFGEKHRLTIKEEGDVSYYLVLDPYEIGKFCFPIDFNKKYESDELAKIVDYQIAYYDVIFQHNNRPLMFNEYASEIKGMFKYFYSLNESIGRSYDDEIRDSFLNSVKDFYFKGEVDYADNKDFAFAIQLSMLSFAVKRLEKTQDRIYFEDKNFFFNDQSLHLLRNYQEDITETNELIQEIKTKKDLDKITLRRDIVVIDKINYLNQAFSTKKIKKKLLYFSSAERTKLIIDAFEKIKGNSENVWRTPDQIYTYLLFREVNKTTIDTKKTLENLEDFKNYKSENLDSSSSNKYIGFPKIINNKKKHLLNILHKIENVRVRELVHIYNIDLEKLKNESKGDLKEEYKLIIDSYSSKNKKTNINKFYTKLKTSFNLQKTMPEIFSENSDIISNVFDSFPLTIKLNKKPFVELYRNLIEYWFTYHRLLQTKKKVESIRDGFLEFILELSELELNAKDEATIDLLLCEVLLYLINPSENSVRDAFNHINIKFHIKENIEYDLIKTYILRKSRESHNAIDICDKHIEDWRFKYSKVLCIISKITNKEFNLNESEINKLIIASTLIEKIIEIFDQIEFFEMKLLKSAVYSNSIYLYALLFHYTKKDRFENKAKTNLTELKKVIDKKKWSPLYPEYLHSEALYEYITLDHFVENIGEKKLTPIKTWEERYSSGLEDIEQARTLIVGDEKKNYYQKLVNKFLKLKPYFNY